jgi:hypothetical protein
MNKILVLLLLVCSPILIEAQTMSVTPSTGTVMSYDTNQVLVSEDNVKNPNGTWTTNCGSIDQNGLFTAPLVATNTLCTVEFTDTASGMSTGTVINVTPAFDNGAQLPVAIVNSSMASTPTPGVVTQVVPLGLQNAINAANCGDTLLLQAGATYPGSYKLPAKACDDQHWIVIRTSAPDSALPAEGTRINPCYAGVSSLPGRPAFSCPANSVGAMTKVVASKGQSAFTLAVGASHYRLGPGLEITRALKDGIHFALISPPGGGNSADHLVIDRDWIHGTAQDETQRGIMLSGLTYVGVVDSYINDFHCTTAIGTCVDSQAIAGGIGPATSGNFKIENNFLEAAAETILFGGSLGNSATPTDITIRHNHMFKPLTWLPGQSGFVGGANTDVTKCIKTPGQCPFIVKNLFELKNAQRVLLEGNILENVWPGYTQHGAGMLISGLNPPALAGAQVYSKVSVVDATFRYNRVAHSTAGMSIVNMGIGTPLGFNLPVARVSVHDNIIDDMSLDYFNNDDSPFVDFHMFAIGSCPACVPISDISIKHNTVLSKNPKVAFILDVAGTQSMGLTFTDNIMSVPAGTVVSGGNATGCAYSGNTNLLRLNACLLPNYEFNGNVFIGGTNTWPAGNYFPSSPTAVGFTSLNGLNGGDYTLLPASSYKNKATDGKDPGADVAAVNTATAGVQ